MPLTCPGELEETVRGGQNRKGENKNKALDTLENQDHDKDHEKENYS